jgi:hypothetical protein
MKLKLYLYNSQDHLMAFEVFEYSNWMHNVSVLHWYNKKAIFSHHIIVLF